MQPQSAGTTTLTGTTAGSALELYNASVNKPCHVMNVESLGTGRVYVCVEPLHEPGQFIALVSGREKPFRYDLEGGIQRVRAYTDTSGTEVTWGKQAVLKL